MEDLQSSPFSWWMDSHNRPPPSQWLHSTLSELDDKIKTMLELIEDNGDTFAERAEMYYQKRPQLIKMLQDLHRSYRALADKYDQLKSESSIKASNNGSVSNSFKRVQPLGDRVKGRPQNSPPIEAPNFNSESIQESSSDASSLEFQSPENSMVLDSDNKLMNEEDSGHYENKNDLRLQEHGYNQFCTEQMKFCKLLEENLSKQAELIRRNDEKREAINELRNENRILSLRESNNRGTRKGKQSQKTKLRGLFCFA